MQKCGVKTFAMENEVNLPCYKTKNCDVVTLFAIPNVGCTSDYGNWFFFPGLILSHLPSCIGCVCALGNGIGFWGTVASNITNQLWSSCWQRGGREGRRQSNEYGLRVKTTVLSAVVAHTTVMPLGTTEAVSSIASAGLGYVGRAWESRW